jgi:translation initiation factor eIF-2B subunit beta
MAAQPREMVVGNIVRRVLGLIRDEAEDDRDAEFALSDIGSESQPQTPRAYDGKFQVLVQNIYAVTHRFIDASLPLDRDSPFRAEDRSSRPPLTSMFSLLSHPEPENSLPSTPGSSSPSGRFTGHGPSKDVRAEVLEGIGEIIDELGQVDDQIAAYALDHIHSNEIILTHTSSTTVQKFLLKAAVKRKFTVIHAESYPNNHEATHATVSGSAVSDDDNLGLEAFQKPLIEHGITVILIPDSAVFALMSRVNKVILGTHSVLANGGLVAAAGTRVIARAAKVHQTPVVVVSGVYKLSPVYPFDFDSLIEYGDPSKVLPYEEGDLVDLVDVQNPIYDYVPAELVDLYITNL